MSLFIVESAQLVYSFEAIYKQIGISVPGPILPSRTAAERPIHLYEGFPPWRSGKSSFMPRSVQPPTVFV